MKLIIFILEVWAADIGITIGIGKFMMTLLLLAILPGIILDTLVARKILRKIHGRHWSEIYSIRD